MLCVMLSLWQDAVSPFDRSEGTLDSGLAGHRVALASTKRVPEVTAPTCFEPGMLGAMVFASGCASRFSR